MSRNMVQKVLYILVAIPVSWLFLQYFLPISLPFLLGLGAALAAEPGVKLLSRRLPRPAATIISVTLVLVLLTTVLALVLGILMRQLGRLQTVLPQLEAAANQGIALLKDRLLTLSQVLPQGLAAAISRLPLLLCLLLCLVQQHMIDLLGGVKIPFVPLRRFVHGLAPLFEGDGGKIHIFGFEDIGIDHDIRGDIEEIGIVFRPPRAMEKNGVEDLVHHHEIHLAVGEGVKKVGIPIEPFPVGGGGGKGLIQSEGHVHEEKPEEAVTF